jgi:hypothetical protein
VDRLPAAFRRNIECAFPGGAAWLELLPSLIAECERRWQLRIAPTPFPLSYSYVAPALAPRDQEVVVKIGVPNPELSTEVRALKRRRIDLLEDELGFDKRRIAGWGAAQGVLSAWWSYEDTGAGWEPAMRCAEVLMRAL